MPADHCQHHQAAGDHQLPHRCECNQLHRGSACTDPGFVVKQQGYPSKLHPLIGVSDCLSALLLLRAGAFRAILAATPQDLLPTVYLCTNRVAPAHAGVELGVGDAILIKVSTVLAVCIV